MKTRLRNLASLKLTLAGMIMVAVTALATYKQGGLSTDWLVIPITVLAINLLAAIVTNKIFRRQRGLMIFHLGLLAAMLLAGAGLLTRFDGHVELVEGQTFDALAVETIHRGIWHPRQLDKLEFTQDLIEVDFAPGLIRRSTRSHVVRAGSNDTITSIQFGDRQAITMNGYRFITTFNKGLAVLMTYRAQGADPIIGTVNFPSYPLLEWKQLNEWTTPDGKTLQLELVPQPIERESAWTMHSQDLDFTVQVHGHELPLTVLRAGDSIEIGGASLTIEALRLWMGYRIDYNPILPWLFTAAIVAILGLALHFLGSFAPARMPRSAQPVHEGANNAVGSVN